jgi:hypothetical protein
MSGMRDASILKAVAGVIREQVQKAYDTLAGRIAGVEAQVKALAEREPERGLDGKDGASVTAEDVLPELKRLVADLVADFPIPKNGKDGTSVTLDDIKPMLDAKHAEWALGWEREARNLLEKAVDRMPVAKDGRDGVDGRDGANGKDADPEAVAAKVIERLDLKGTRTDMQKLCKELVEAEFAKVPAPKDGKDGTSVSAEEVRKMVEAEAAKIPAPKDGKDGKSVSAEDIRKLIDAEVAKIPTPKDGTSVSLDDVRGLIEQKAAEWQLDFEKRAHETLQKAVDRMPQPKDGRDGKDGIGVDSFTAEIKGRMLHIKMQAADGIHERVMRLPIPMYKDVWKDGQYEKDDMVTWGGSMWIALRDTKSKPGQYGDWKLIVKKGRDGKGE